LGVDLGRTANTPAKSNGPKVNLRAFYRKFKFEFFKAIHDPGVAKWKPRCKFCKKKRRPIFQAQPRACRLFHALRLGIPVDLRLSSMADSEANVALKPLLEQLKGALDPVVLLDSDDEGSATVTKLGEERAAEADAKQWLNEQGFHARSAVSSESIELAAVETNPILVDSHSDVGAENTANARWQTSVVVRTRGRNPTQNERRHLQENNLEQRRSKYISQCLQFFFATRMVIRQQSIQASHPLETGLEQYRVALTTSHQSTSVEIYGKWETTVQAAGDRLELLLREAALHGMVATLLSSASEASAQNERDVSGSHQCMDQIIPKVWLGDLMNAEDVRALAQQGITHICSCCDRPQRRHADVFKYLKVQVPDSDRANIARYFWKTNAFIQDAVDAGGSVLVHCTTGVSTSAAIVIAYLMQSCRLATAAALTVTRAVRPVVAPNRGFLLQLQDFEAKLLNPVGYYTTSISPPSHQNLTCTVAQTASSASSLQGSTPQATHDPSRSASAESQPHIHALESEISALTSRIRDMAKKQTQRTPDQSVPRSIRFGGATLRLTNDGRLMVSGVHIPDPKQNAFAPDPADANIWLEALLAWCTRYQSGLNPAGWYDGIKGADVADASAKLCQWLSEIGGFTRSVQPPSPAGSDPAGRQMARNRSSPRSPSSAASAALERAQAGYTKQWPGMTQSARQRAYDDILSLKRALALEGSQLRPGSVSQPSRARRARSAPRQRPRSGSFDSTNSASSRGSRCHERGEVAGPRSEAKPSAAFGTAARFRTETRPQINRILGAPRVAYLPTASIHISSPERAGQRFPGGDRTRRQSGDRGQQSSVDRARRQSVDRAGRPSVGHARRPSVDRLREPSTSRRSSMEPARPPTDGSELSAKRQSFIKYWAKAVRSLIVYLARVAAPAINKHAPRTRRLPSMGQL
jgi:hypothetical protein